MELVIILVVAGIIFLVVKKLKAQDSGRQQAWRSFALDRSLVFVPGGMTGKMIMHGVYDDVEVALACDKAGQNTVFTVATAEFVPGALPEGLAIIPEALVDTANLEVGSRDIEVGDPGIDDLLWISCEDMAATQALLADAPVRLLLKRFFTRPWNAFITSDSVHVSIEGFVEDHDEIRSLLDELVMVIDVLETAADGGEVSQLPEPTPHDGYADDSYGADDHGMSAEPVVQPFEYDDGAMDELQLAVDAPELAVAPADELSLVRDDAPLPDSEPADAEQASFEPPDLRDSIEPGGVALDLQESGAEEARFEPPDLRDSIEPTAPDTESAVTFGQKVDVAAVAEPTELPRLPGIDTPPPAAIPAGLAEYDDSKGGIGSLAELAELQDRLEDRSLDSDRRKAIVAEQTGRPFALDIEIDRVGWTVGFDLPSRIKEGRTVEGALAEVGQKVAVRFPEERNDELDAMSSGTPLSCRVRVAGWDDLFERIVFEVQE